MLDASMAAGVLGSGSVMRIVIKLPMTPYFSVFKAGSM